MRLREKHVWFLAFTVVFAVLAGYVFWGAWSPSMAPVMPDCPTSYPVHWFRDWLRGWLANGKFAPAEAINWIGSPYLWTEFQYAFAAYMAGLGMAYFLRGRGLPPVAAYGAGLFLSFCGYWFTLFSAGHLGWFQWMTYGVFAFGLIDRALEKGKLRHWLLLGACLAWGSMHQPDLWLLFTVFSGIYFVFRLVVCICDLRKSSSRSPFPVPRSPFLVKWAKGAFLALAAMLAIGGASFRSAFVNDLAGRDRQIESGETIAGDIQDDAEKRWIFTTNWSMPPEATKEFFRAGIEGDTSCPMTLAIGQKRRNGIRPYTGALGRPLGATTGNYRQHSLYVGWITCLMAMAGLAFGIYRREKTVLFFAVSAIVFWLFSMGRYCEPVYRMVFALPFGDSLRAPVKWHHLTEFCLVVLSGYGLKFCLESPLKRFGTVVKTAAVALVVIWGAGDLAREAHRFCAPHRVHCDLQMADARMLLDPRGRLQLEALRAKVVGTCGAMAIVEVPRREASEGDKEDLPRPDGTVLALGILSLLASLAVGVVSLAPVADRKC